MMDKNREAFEAWVNQQKVSHIIGEAVYEGDGVYKHLQHQALWNAWQESRQAIEVELPESKANVTYTNSGFNWAVGECAKAITSLGIRVKGNEE